MLSLVLEDNCRCSAAFYTSGSGRSAATVLAAMRFDLCPSYAALAVETSACIPGHPEYHHRIIFFGSIQCLEHDCVVQKACTMFLLLQSDKKWKSALIFAIQCAQATSDNGRMNTF